MKHPLPYSQSQVSEPHPSEITNNVLGTRQSSLALCSAPLAVSLGSVPRSPFSTPAFPRFWAVSPSPSSALGQRREGAGR